MNRGQRIVWLNKVDKNDIGFVGGKGANLGEMTKAGVPVPQGFVVTANAYFEFMKGSGLTQKIRSILEPLNVQNSKQLMEVSARVRELILKTPMPEILIKQIQEAYDKMSNAPVAVRSSATAEDLPEASFAGQQSTFLNIQGRDNVVSAVHQCWASLFEARAVFYREEQGFEHFKVGIAVPVQKMVQSEASGVLFTLEPVTSDTSKIAIEAVYGLGETIVSGDVTPDLYIVDKKSMTITRKEIGAQQWKLIRANKAEIKKGNLNIKIPLTPEEQKQQKINDGDIIQLAKLGKYLEDYYKFPQDVEWAKEGNNIYIVQTRPVTTVRAGQSEPREKIDAPVLFSGAPASPGIASGPVKIAPDASHLDKIMKGDVLVTEMTTPDFVPAMKRASAIITDRGGRTAHAAIVSRELGIPCVVGSGKATQILKDGQVVTVDGTEGKIYDGKIVMKTVKAATPRNKIKTKTKVYINLAQPELADSLSSRDVDGVGLLRAEFIIAQIGEHPRYMISQNRGHEFVDKLAVGLSTITAAFNPRPVVYRTSDFKTNEYRELKGGQEYEEVEENPMLGYRGVSRYTTDTDEFKLELEAIKKVRQTYKNLWVMLPFVRTVEGLTTAKTILEQEGLVRSDDFKLWMMVEVPSNIILIEKFLAVGIDGISIGSNDLTQLILGVDRDNERLASIFDERNEAVMVALKRAVTTAKKMGVTASICGQAPSVFPEITQNLVKWGITSVSVSPDMIDTTRDIIAEAEKMLKQGD
ncbi:phosphoenolpyruvate synthase [Chloroflexota bacterium]